MFRVQNNIDFVKRKFDFLRRNEKGKSNDANVYSPLATCPSPSEPKTKS
jgi:hypothetical protein